MSKLQIGLVGSQFVSSIHYEALRRAPAAEVVAVASPTEEHVRDFAEQRGIVHWFTDYRRMLEMDEIDVVVFDCDGVLLDVRESYSKAVARTTSVIVEAVTGCGLPEDLFDGRLNSCLSRIFAPVRSTIFGTGYGIMYLSVKICATTELVTAYPSLNPASS